MVSHVLHRVWVLDVAMGRGVRDTGNCGSRYALLAPLLPHTPKPAEAPVSLLHHEMFTHVTLFARACQPLAYPAYLKGGHLF